jgi:hypothetical protein
MPGVLCVQGSACVRPPPPSAPPTLPVQTGTAPQPGRGVTFALEEPVAAPLDAANPPPATMHHVGDPTALLQYVSGMVDNGIPPLSTVDASRYCVRVPPPCPEAAQSRNAFEVVTAVFEHTREQLEAVLQVGSRKCRSRWFPRATLSRRVPLHPPPPHTHIHPRWALQGACL